MKTKCGKGNSDPIKEYFISKLFLLGSTLSVSASIHSTLSASTLADLENFAASNLNIQKKGLFRKKVSLKDVLSWQAEGIRYLYHSFIHDKDIVWIPL